MGLDDAGKALDRCIQCGVPTHPFAHAVALEAKLGKLRAGAVQRGVGGLVQGRALDAQLAGIGRMVGIAAHARDRGAVVFDQHPAPDPAIGTGGAGGLRGLCGSSGESGISHDRS